MRLKFLSAAAASVLLLTACGSGGDDSADSAGTTPPDTGSSLTRYDKTTDIRDALADTDHACGKWNDVDDGVASCLMAGDAGVHGVYIADNPAATAAVTFQQDPDTPAVVVGQNWLFDCGPGGTFGLDRCIDVTKILGGTLVEPDPQ
jgi:hypothetical protein